MFFETPPSAVYLLWAEFLYGDSLSDKYQINSKHSKNYRF